MRPVLLACLSVLLLFSVGASALTPPGDNAKKWRQIDALLKKDQTTSAAKLVEEIYQQARRRQDTPEYLRALLYKLRILDEKEEDADIKAIRLLEKDLRTAQFPARPILHSLLAQLYATYYRQHRYQLYDRTPGAAPATDSLATWDAARLGSAVIGHYRASLADEAQRQQQLPLARLGYAVRGGDAEGRRLRPTLYDLLAHRALDGLGDDEFYLTKPAQQFEVKNPALLGPAADFARLPLSAPAADSLNGQFSALKVWQQLTQFRLADPNNPAALADADRLRLRFVWQHATFADKDSLYRAALLRAAETYKALPISAEFLFAAAENWEGNQPARALELARAAEARFPKSRGARLAGALRQRIERQELSFTTEEVVLPGQPWLLRIEQRNVGQAYARAYRLRTARAVRQTIGSAAATTFAQEYAPALAAAPAATWPLPLPGPQDYKAHSVEQAGPALPVGRYLVVVSTTADNPTQERPGVTTAYAELSVSELSQVRRADPAGVRLLVLHRQSGQPLAGIGAQAFNQQYDQKTRQQLTTLGPVVPTGADGVALLSISPENDRNGQIRAVLLTRGADSLLVRAYFGGRRYDNQRADEPEKKTFLFTDRAIYRPGQTLYFKGISAETRAGKSRLLTQKAVSVRLQDVNNQTVQTLNFTTSDFGSFHGSLVLPAGLLNGEMRLETDDGSVGFSVEDYKRPTFQVTFAPLTGTPALGQTVTARGTATAYAGPAIDGAAVQYRVVRRTVWPLYRPYFGGRRGGYLPPDPNDRAEVEITNGTAQTDAAGHFAIAFTAQADTTGAGRRGRPGYVFTITADVTDAAGETHSGAQTVTLGTDALTLRFAGLPELLNRAALPNLQLFSTNAAGEPAPARGQLRLYRLTPPARALRPRPWEQPDTTALSQAAFQAKFPLDPYGDEADAATWPRALVLTQEFNTAPGPTLNLREPLARQAPGRYLLTATAPNGAGNPPATAEQFFTLFDPAAATLPYPTPDWFVPLADSVAPGQAAEFLLGSSEAGARVLLEVEAQGQLLHHEWLTLAAGEQRRVAVPVPAALGETTLYAHATQVRDNRLYRHDATVQVAPPPAPLALSIATFRDKLQPGQQETWRVTIRQANGQPAAAELLATMYDQSLDVFREHSFDPLKFRQPYFPPTLRWDGEFGRESSRGLLVQRRSVSVEGETEIKYPYLNKWGYREDYPERMMEPMREVIDAPMVSGTTVIGAKRRMSMAAPKRMTDDRQQLNEVVVVGYGTQQRSELTGSVSEVTTQEGRAVDLSKIPTRSDFRETALWAPALRTNAQGETVLEFQMPEAVTRWELMMRAHDQQLRSGALARQLVTQKQLQITANAPRFFRQGDQLTLSAKVSNLAGQPLRGTAQLFLLDARTQQPLPALLASPAQQPFNLAANASAAVSWQLTLPETPAGQVPLEAITYRVVASAQLPVARGELPAKEKRKQRKENKRATGNSQLATVEDGEENTVPVLPNRVLITESLPLPIVGPSTKTFELTKLLRTTSPTRRNYALTLEMTQNPVWYAVQALPYLTEYPYECAEQVFSRLYANLLAANILRQNSRLRPVLAEWQRAAQSGDQKALASKLEQNQELKNLLLQETPWVRDAQSDTERLRRLAGLFDETRLRTETAAALAKLAQMQLPDGAFPLVRPDARRPLHHPAHRGRLRQAAPTQRLRRDPGRPGPAAAEPGAGLLGMGSCSGIMTSCASKKA